MLVFRLIAAQMVLGCLLIAMAQAAEPISYARDIKPILKERCFACHGALQQQAKLRSIPRHRFATAERTGQQS